MKFREEQEVERVMVVSTAHVAKSDMDLLDKGETSVSAYHYEYGEFVTVSADIPAKEMAEAIQKEGYTSAFAFLYDVAKAKGYQMLRLDCDGPEYEDLPKFDW